MARRRAIVGQAPQGLVSLLAVLHGVLVALRGMGLADDQLGHVPLHQALEDGRLEGAVQDRVVLPQRRRRQGILGALGRLSLRRSTVSPWTPAPGRASCAACGGPTSTWQPAG